MPAALSRSPTSWGFNVHEEVAIPAHDRARLERLCRYVCRPPIAQERLEEHSSGKLRHTFKKPWKDGTVALLLEPLDLIAREARVGSATPAHAGRADERIHGSGSAVTSHALGAAAILEKPFAPERLLSTLASTERLLIQLFIIAIVVIGGRWARDRCRVGLDR